MVEPNYWDLSRDWTLVVIEWFVIKYISMDIFNKMDTY